MLLMLALVQPSFAEGPYAVIAAGPNGKFGTTNNDPDFAHAVKTAKWLCGKDCELVAWTRGERCVAVSIGKKQSLSWAYGRTADTAQRSAHSKCQSVDTNCWDSGLTCNFKHVYSGSKWAPWAVTPAMATPGIEPAVESATTGQEPLGGSKPPQ